MGTGSAKSFSNAQLEAFAAEQGAFSIVTKQEAKKSQITITGPEKKIVEAHFGNTIHKGKKSHSPKALKTFNVFLLDGKQSRANLTVNYPKPPKRELQVYASEAQGFRPRAGDIWFIFKRSNNKDLFIGFADSASWDGLGRVSILDEEEADDYIFQTLVNEPVAVKSAKLIKSLKFPRSLAVARKSFKLARYQCEIDAGHETFLNRTTGHPYMEAHHLVPLGLQNSFQNSLDVPSNVVVLCPGCHRLIHHGKYEDVKQLVRKLYDLRRRVLNHSGIIVNFAKLLKAYK